MTTGVFLYYPDAPYLQETKAALRKLVDLQYIEADAGIVSNLVPGTLQHGVESWLILHEPNRDQVLLILPFPDENHLELLSNTAEGFPDSIISELSKLIEVFRYRDFYRFPEGARYSEWFRRFQYLYSDVSLYSLQDPPERQQLRQELQKTSQNIHRRRVSALRRAERENDFSKSVVQLENVFLRATDKLFINIRNRGFEEVVPSIVDDFWNVMDGETIRFLITSETVRAFAGKNPSSNFDYSAPGCGLWKAIERELNLSLVLHLRREAGIVKSISIPWRGSRKGKFHILTDENQSINLNQRKSKSPENLEGITLGPMKYMLNLGYCNTVKEKLENLFPPNDPMLHFLLDQHKKDKSLPSCLDQIIQLRNGHAHIQAMSQEKFGALRNLILPSQCNPETCLVKILELKRAILEYWEDKGDRFTDCLFLTCENSINAAFSRYNRMNVKYNKDKSTTELVATHRDRAHLCIATFNKIEDANAALAALAKAADDGEQSWNVLDFKKTLERARRAGDTP